MYLVLPKQEINFNFYGKKSLCFIFYPLKEIMVKNILIFEAIKSMKYCLI